jgi:hypothetical protein
MVRVGFEPKIKVFGRGKTIHTVYRSASVIIAVDTATGCRLNGPGLGV